MGHTVQAELPFCGLYVPGAHAAHSSPLGPVYPGTQVQLDMKLDKGGDQVF